jgi:hypothetical protein
MPSIPQSLLWISLVVLWLFVLVPMLISKRDQVRRTSDVALATRVLNSGAAARLLRRGGPAAGHRTNPDWQPDDEEDRDLDDLDDVDSAETEEMRQPVTVAAAETEPEVLGADDAVVAEEEPEPVAEDEASDDSDDSDGSDDEEADQYEYVDDTSGIPVAEEPPAAVAHGLSQRRRYESDTAAAVSARKYAFRKRVLMVMALALVASSAAAFLLNPGAWWICGSFAAVTVLYLGYLRRQTRIEERVQRRRMQRVARSRLGVENAYDREFDVVPSRLRRPGSVVLEIDDEDPIFDHLDYAPYARDHRWHGDLPRAVGQ